MRSIRKGNAPEGDNDFEVITNTEMIEQFSGFTRRG